MMPCKCSGIEMKTCSSKLVPTNILTRPNDLVLVKNMEKHKFVFRLLEEFYEKCAGYNLRYCPLRRVGRRDRCLSIAMKDLMILMCFLMANFVVFVTILTKMGVNVFYVLRDTAFWLRSRSLLNPKSNETCRFETNFLKHDYPPPNRKSKLF